MIDGHVASEGVSGPEHIQSHLGYLFVVKRSVITQRMCL